MARRARFERGWFAEQMLALADAKPSFESSLERKINPDAIRAYANRMKSQVETEKRTGEKSRSDTDQRAAG